MVGSPIPTCYREKSSVKYTVMKLSIIETVNRREFLKTTANTALSGNLLTKMLNLGIKTTPQAVNDALYNTAEMETVLGDICDYGEIIGDIPNGFTPYIVNLVATDPETALMIEYPQLIEKCTNGAFGKIMASTFQTEQPIELIKKIINMHDGLGEISIAAIDDLRQFIPTIGKLFNTGLMNLIRKDPTVAAKTFYKIGVITRDEAFKYVSWNAQAEEAQEFYRELRQKDAINKTQTTKKLDQQDIKFKPRPDDEIYGSSMHQSFENKLKSVFAIT